jgi:cyclic pyranopterin phosphate synthase
VSDQRTLRDAFGRDLHYLRLSVTDRCNFSCVYCLPSGCPRDPGSQPLSAVEIDRLVRAFSDLGFWKVRVTGGEPTIRPDICEIVRRIAAAPGIRRIGLTTNGYRLAKIARELRDAGLTSLNVSLDSLDPARFEKVTGFAGLDTAVAGIEEAVAAGIPSVKINAVLLRGMDDREFDDFLSWTKRVPVMVRFIELMQTGENSALFEQHHRPVEEIRQKLLERGWAPLAKEDRADGPATCYRHPDHVGTAGLIAPYSAGFCESCNRLRVSSAGDLKLCLFGEGDRKMSLRPFLGSDDQKDELIRFIESSVQAKPESHSLREGRWGSTTTLASTGG